MPCTRKHIFSKQILPISCNKEDLILSCKEFNNICSEKKEGGPNEKDMSVKMYLIIQIKGK